MDFRISSAGSGRNPLQDVYRYQRNNPFQLPVTWGQNTSSAGGAGGTDLNPFLNRAGLDDDLRNRRNQQSKQRPEELGRIQQKIWEREQEISRLDYQIQNAGDAGLKRSLESTRQVQNAGFASLQGEFARQSGATGGGFVGNENKIDHIGSFVTLV